MVFDMGGTNMRFAVSRDGKELGEQKTAPTPRLFEDGLRMFQEIANELAKGEKIVTIAGGVAGPLDKERTMLMAVRTSLPDWNQKSLSKELENLFSVPVYLENDAALAGLGEATKGAGRKYGIVAYVTVSTGVGGARIVDGMIDRNRSGFEPGHQIINYDGDIRTLGEHVSGSGLRKRFGKSAEEITDSGIWEEAAQLLAFGMSNTVLHWAPDVLVLGGPVILQSPLPFEMLKEYIEKSVLQTFHTVPEIKKAELGDQGGLAGALAFLRKKMEA